MGVRMNEQEKKKYAADVAGMARLLPLLEAPPCGEVAVLGDMMRNWLYTEVSDNGSAVDSGAGSGSYDLWVKFGGKEIYINLRLSNNELAKAAT